MTTQTPERSASARERLLAAADELFYAEGIHTVGIDRVIEHAGVAKATLYSTFGSKDELIQAYLQQRQAIRDARIERHLAGVEHPREQILALFDALAEAIAEPTFRGCAFQRAGAESPPGSKVATATEAYRAGVRNRFVEFADAAGAADPVGLAQRLVLLYDGAAVAAAMDGDRHAVVTAQAVAAGLIDASTHAEADPRSSG